MPKVSIILPTYKQNITKLTRMIRSVLDQSVQDFELIIVEDGNGPEIHNEIVRATDGDDRIRLIWQENAGVSAARNRGIACAEGDFIAFVDDDDLLSPYFLEESLQTMADYDCDFVIGGILREYGNTKRVKDFEKTDYAVKVLEGKELADFRYSFLGLSERFFDGAYFGRGPYAKLIRKSSCNVLFHEDMSIGEDQIFNLDILNQINKAVLVYRIWYIYIISTKSTTVKCSPAAREKMERLIKEVSSRIEIDSPQVRLFWCDYLLECISTITLRWYGNRDCPLTQAQRIKELRALTKEEPWKALNDKSYFLQAGKKRKMFWVLLKTGFLGIAWECWSRIRYR